ncbi:acyl-CoA synthetase [Rhodococcoides yunnanense]|uniref:acyl-CoA synthetase n=1 Tax=Rhodococcoides yunnanense TaxID=278209 RepID=UPI0009348BEE|nr:long-chain fatty acid--CoA ligase [Rhodococcus yunnanensis]
MLNNGIGSWPYRRARQSPDAVAISYRTVDYTYRHLAERATRLAHALRGMGVRAGDRVALLSPNHPAYLEALFATGLIGAVFVPLNARLTAPEVAYALRDSGSGILLHAAALSGVSIEAAESTVRRIVLDTDPSTDLDTSVLDYDTIIAASSTDRIDVAVTLDDHCMIMYTSGTTGRPKGVVLSHNLVLFAVLNTIIDLDLTSDEVALVMAPLFHTAALNTVSLPTLLKGGRLIIEEGFDPGRALAIIESEKVTYSFGVPTMLDAMASQPHWSTTDVTSIRRWVVGAAPVPPRTLRTYTARGINLCQGYGLTETGPGASLLGPRDVERKLGTTGTPQFFTDVRVVDLDNKPVATGERGEIQISGPNVTKEYWNRPDATADAHTEDGWFRSGDVGTVDDEGYLTVVDRLKDMIISGGENIYPAEVEAEVLNMPGVIGCAVFGISDAKWGEVGCAAVTVEGGVTITHESMVAFLMPRLAKYKIPKSLVVLDDIPRNATGKIRKDLLRVSYESH